MRFPWLVLAAAAFCSVHAVISRGEGPSLAQTAPEVLRRLPNSGWCATFKQAVAPDITSDEQRPYLERYLRNIVSRNSDGETLCAQLQTPEFKRRLFDETSFENRPPGADMVMENWWGWARRCAYLACTGSPGASTTARGTRDTQRDAVDGRGNGAAGDTGNPQQPPTRATAGGLVGLEICNRTGEMVFVSLVRHVSAEAGSPWVAQGWYPVKATGCSFQIKFPTSDVYVYARAVSGRQWAGADAGVCVPATSFRLVNPRTSAATCLSTENLRQFRLIRTTEGRVSTWTLDP